MLSNMYNKSKSYKKTFTNKKKTIPNKVHPHLECIQLEITTIEEELSQLEQIEKQTELTSEQQLDKQIKQACLERYQTTLVKLSDTTMVNKVRSYQENLDSKKDESILSLLQLFYIVRLSQLGLFDFIKTTPAVKKAITDVSDQLVGAAVYYQTDPSSRVKSQKRKQVFSILKKLELGSEDEISDQVSYKDVKELIQHVWDNTKKQEVVDHKENGEWAVLSFKSMMDDEIKAQNETTPIRKNPPVQKEQPSWEITDKSPEQMGWNVIQNNIKSDGWDTTETTVEWNTEESEKTCIETENKEESKEELKEESKEESKESEIVLEVAKEDVKPDKETTVTTTTTLGEPQSSDPIDNFDNWRRRDDNGRGRSIRGRGSNRGTRGRERGRGSFTRPNGRGRGNVRRNFEFSATNSSDH